jgi:HAD superfamily hydrolase (TIGR01450 family)
MIENVKLFLLDMDGTVYLEDKLIPGVAEKINEIRSSGKKICFLTNNSSRSPSLYIEKLSRLGIKIDRSEIYTSGDSSIRYLKKYHPKQKVFLLGTKALVEQYQDSGIILTENEPDIVMLGYDTELTYQKLIKAVNCLKTAKHYFATHDDINCPASPVYVPDVGSFIALFEKSTGRVPEIVFGKPYKQMGEAIKEMFGLSPNEIAMAGDRLYTDMRFAVDNGFVSILVLSGETTKQMYEKSGMKVDYVLSSLAELSLK